MKTLLVLFVLFVGCSKTAPAPAVSGASCEQAFDQLTKLGVFGGTTYGGDALMFGVGCADLSADGLGCIAQAKAVEELGKCQPPAEHKNRIDVNDPAKPPMDPTLLVNGACACKDKKCLLEYGAAHGDDFHKLSPKASEQLKCLFQLVVGKQPKQP